MTKFMSEVSAILHATSLHFLPIISKYNCSSNKQKNEHQLYQLLNDLEESSHWITGKVNEEGREIVRTGEKE